MLGIKKNQLWYVGGYVRGAVNPNGRQAMKLTDRRYHDYLLVPITSAQKKRLEGLDGRIKLNEYNIDVLEARLRDVKRNMRNAKNAQQREAYLAERENAQNNLDKEKYRGGKLVDEKYDALYGKGKPLGGENEKTYNLYLTTPADKPGPFSISTVVKQSDIVKLRDYKLTSNAKQKTKLTMR